MTTQTKTLRDQDIDFLIKNLKDERISAILTSARGDVTILGDTGITRHHKVIFSDKDVEQISERLSTLLVERGVGKDDEINQFGRYLDYLIGIFNSYSWKGGRTQFISFLGMIYQDD